MINQANDDLFSAAAAPAPSKRFRAAALRVLTCLIGREFQSEQHYNESMTAKWTHAGKSVKAFLSAGGRDDVSAFRCGASVYFVSTNDALGYIGLTEYDASSGEEIGSVFLQADHEIEESLGKQAWKMSARTIARRLSEYIY